MGRLSKLLEKSKVVSKKPKVLMYHTIKGMVGGPATYINTIISSKLNKKYEFDTCYQGGAVGGINIPLFRRLISEIRSKKPDIVHVHGLQSEGFYGVLAARLAGCKKIVTTVHGFAFDDNNTPKYKRFLFKNFVEPLTLRLSNKVYCVCEYAAQRDIIKRNLKKNNCGYIYNPVPNMQVKENRNSIRNKLYFNDEDVVFAISGRIVKDKGFDILAKSIKIINQYGPNRFKLLVIGDGDYREIFEQELKSEIQRGQVVMVGQTNSVADYLNAADAFIFPSYHENLPISLLEAGKMGLPCVVSNVGGIPEIIKNNVSGIVIEGFEPKMYANAILEIINNQSMRKFMSENIIKDIELRFSMDSFLKQLEEIYKCW